MIYSVSLRRLLFTSQGNSCEACGGKVAMRQVLRVPQFSPTNYQSILLHSLISAWISTSPCAAQVKRDSSHPKIRQGCKSM
jgi:hypothetical protein